MTRHIFMHVAADQVHSSRRLLTRVGPRTRVMIRFKQRESGASGLGMSEDSDHASPEQRRTKRQRLGLGADPPPFLAFDNMGPDETTADASDDAGERSTHQQSPTEATGTVIQTTEEISRLQMENVRLRVELDELRKQLHLLHQGLQERDQQEHEQRPQEGGISAEERDEALRRIEVLERERDSARNENEQLVQELRKSHATDQSNSTTLKHLEQENSNLKDTHEKLQRTNEELKEQSAAAQMRLQAVESEAQETKHALDGIQTAAKQAEKAIEDKELLTSRLEILEKELEAAHATKSHLDEVEAENAALQEALSHKEAEIISLQHGHDVDVRLNEENEELKNMLVDLGVRDHERLHELQAVKTDRDSLNGKLKETQTELEHVREQSRSQSEKIASLEAEAKSADIQSKEINHRVTVLEEALELKDSQNTDLRHELHRLSVRDKEQDEMIQHLTAEQSHLKRLNEEFKQRTTSQNITITEQRAEIRSLHRQCTEQGQNLEETQQERQEFESLAQSRYRTLEDRERQIQELRQHSEQLQSTVTQLEEALEEKTQKLEQQAQAAWQHKRAADEELQSVQAEHKHEIETLRREHDEELATQLGLQQRVVEEVKSHEVEMGEKHNKEVQRLRAQVASLRATTASTESEYNTTKALLDDTRGQLNQTLHALEDLQARTAEERSRLASERHRAERHTGELESRNSKLQTEIDELRRKDKAMDERCQKLEQTLVDQSVELRQLKAPLSTEIGSANSSQNPVNEVESLRREFSAQSSLWERMRDEMMDYINRVNGENSTLRAELDRWQAEEGQRIQAIEDSLKRKFLKQTEQLESLASFKEDAQNSLVGVAQEDLRKLTQENLAMRREHIALYERAEMLEIQANQASSEISRTSERLNAVTARLQEVEEQDEHLRTALKEANELVIQSQNRTKELEGNLKTLRHEFEEKLAEAQHQLDQSKMALHASDATAQNLRIKADVLESQQKSQAEAAVKYVDMLFFIMKVDRRRIQDLTFVKKHLMLYFPPPVGVFPVEEEPSRRRGIRSMYDAATFALAVVRFRRGQQSGSRVLALEYEKQLRAMK